MSGSGGTVYDPTPPVSRCETLTFRTILNSPVPKVVAKIEQRLKENKLVLLDIEVELIQDSLKIAIAKFEGEKAGAITSDALLRLLQCIAEGHPFVAEVKELNGARVEVQVKHK